MEGWIKLHRQIIDNEFYLSEKFTRIQAWIDLLMLATIKPRTVFIRGNAIKIERGQLCWAVYSLASRWQWNKRTVLRYLSMLTKKQQIEYKVHNRITTVITIQNYDRYQDDTQQSAQQSGNRVHTNKNVKKVKNIDTNVSMEVVGNQTNSTIALFKTVNPSYERLFANKTQRAAIERLITKHGVDKITRAIEAVKSVYGHPYAPQITTPVQLEQGMGKLIAYYQQQKARDKKLTVTEI